MLFFCSNNLYNFFYVTGDFGGSRGKDSMEGIKRIESKKTNEVEELKDNLLSRYSGYITNLKHEFSRKKKKEKLPKEAKKILLAWWNIHFKWPYPTVIKYLFS